MIVTTTPNFDGANITAYKGLVTGEAIVGANIVKDLFASVRDIVGGRSAAYEQELEKARNLAMNEMVEKAEELGANAIVGIDLDYETLGTGSMLMVSITGTAVTVENQR
jgi:uncharacterized protein YbjQ (UPF0145 family)